MKKYTKLMGILLALVMLVALMPMTALADEPSPTPTPGGSGVAELMFRLYYADYLPDASVAILAAMLWRAIFYYPFLIMGTVVLPRWIGKRL